MRWRFTSFALALTLSCSGSRHGDGPAAVTLTGQDMGTTVSAKVGDQLEVRLASPRGVAPEYRVSWAEQPVIEGAAIRSLRHAVEPPPADVDGGSTAYRYRFEAIAPGTATISIGAVDPGESAQQEPWTATVDVGE